MRSDPLKNISKPDGPTPQSGFYLQLRGERPNTTTELRVMESGARIGAVAALVLALLGAWAMFTQLRTGVLSARDQRLAIVVVSAFLLGAWTSFGWSRVLRRKRLSISDQP